MAIAQAAAAVAAPVVVAAGAHNAANLSSTACRRGSSRWALPGGFRWLRRRAHTWAVLVRLILLLGLVLCVLFIYQSPRFAPLLKPYYWRARRGARATGRGRGLVVVAEFGGSYEDGFEDVHKNIINYFTYKATHTVLHQLYEMNPPSYAWLYNYVTVNDPLDGDYFLRLLAKERQDLAERVMITRLHLYGKWIKECDHAMMYERISKENLDIMRQRLLETVVWPTDDTRNGE